MTNTLDDEGTVATQDGAATGWPKAPRFLAERSALSPSEREELRTRGTRLPLVLVLVLLAGALVLPYATQGRIDRLRVAINDVAEPARTRTSEIQLDLALEAAARRGLLLTGDPQLARDLETSRRRRLTAEADLVRHARQLDVPVQLRVAALSARLRGLDTLVDTSRIAARRAAVDGGLVQHQAEFDAALAAADSLRLAILDSEASHRRSIADTERTVAILTAALVLLGLGASILVARLGGRFHSLALRLEDNEQRVQRSAANERDARAAAEQRRHDLERVTESRTRLIRGFTHDVKNPLGAADGYLALLDEGIMGPLGERQHATIGRVRRSIGVALGLIGDLLEIERAESGRLELRTKRIDPVRVVSEVVDSFRPGAEAKGLTITLHLARDLPPLDTDERRLRQVLGNLVSNAVKYTPEGGFVRVRGHAITDAGDTAEPSVLVEVEDTGPGIAPEQVPRLFEEFTRFNPGAAEGSGVGLAIAQKLAEALGGRISVRTELGRGSNFALRIPCRAPAQKS